MASMVQPVFLGRPQDASLALAISGGFSGCVAKTCVAPLSRTVPRPGMPGRMPGARVNSLGILKPMVETNGWSYIWLYMILYGYI